MTETATVQEELRAMNEALMLGALRQHELTDAAEELNARLNEEITERRNAEAGLRQSEERYRTLFELCPVAVYSCDASGMIQAFNSQAAELWGREPGLGDPSERFCGSLKMYHPDGSVMPHDQCPMAEVLSGKIAETRNVDVRIERPDGSRIDVIVNIRPLKSRTGGITGAINCAYDVTDLRKAEEIATRLAAEMAGFESAVYEAALITVTDVKGRITHINENFMRLSGYGREELVGQVPHRLSFIQHKKELFRDLVSTLAGGKVWRSEVENLGKNGSLYWVDTTIAPVFDKHGKPVQYIAVGFDITARKKAERHQEFLTGELAHRGGNLLAVVQALMMQTLSGTRPLAEERGVLAQRLRALARSQSVLLSGVLEGAPVAEIVRNEIESFSDRVNAVGPADLMLNPRTTQTFAFVIHELSTNATKHGALSVASGHVEVRWWVEGTGADARFRFEWRERQGPAVVPPTRRGFGRQLLERVVAREFGSPPKISYGTEGLLYEIDTPLSILTSDRAEADLGIPSTEKGWPG